MIDFFGSNGWRIHLRCDSKPYLSNVYSFLVRSGTSIFSPLIMRWIVVIVVVDKRR